MDPLLSLIKEKILLDDLQIEEVDQEQTRNGKPVSPRSLLVDLVAAGSSNMLRNYTALELEIRYGCNVAIEIDMTAIICRCDRHIGRIMSTKVQIIGTSRTGGIAPP